MTLRRAGVLAAGVLIMLGGAARASDAAPGSSAQDPAARDQRSARCPDPAASGTGSATASDVPQARATPRPAPRAASQDQRRAEDEPVLSTLSEDSRADAYASPSLR